MRKKLILVSTAAILAGSLAGCAGGNAAYLSGVKASEYVKPCDYSSIPVEEDSPSVSDEYVDYMVQYNLSNTATTEEITDREDVESGDIVNIDYVGTKDGEEFDGGSATGYDLTIGSGSFIDGFEGGLIGHKVGETVDLDLTFPEDYSSTDLAGQDVVFTVTINKIQQKVTPELTDDWVVSQNISGVSTVDEYSDYIYDQLMQQAQSSYDSDVQSKIAEYLVENSTYLQDPPQEMIDRLVESAKTRYTSYAEQYGMELDNFLTAFLGADEDDPEQILTDTAEESAKELLVMKAIADKEGLNPSRTEFNTQLSSYAAQAGYSSIAEFKKSEDAESVRESMMFQNVLSFLQKRAVVSEPSGDADAEETGDTSSESEDSTEASEDTGEAATEDAKGAAEDADASGTADTKASDTEK